MLEKTELRSVYMVFVYTEWRKMIRLFFKIQISIDVTGYKLLKVLNAILVII